jgi:hypothetical protein|tara:strand:+ start:440 stop:649 length:210 start_codon:yes stop_codon:yes gene_type:complete
MKDYDDIIGRLIKATVEMKEYVIKNEPKLLDMIEIIEQNVEVFDSSMAYEVEIGSKLPKEEKKVKKSTK